jgi:hypothetical protein
MYSGTATAVCQHSTRQKYRQSIDRKWMGQFDYWSFSQLGEFSTVDYNEDKPFAAQLPFLVLAVPFRNCRISVGSFLRLRLV